MEILKLSNLNFKYNSLDSFSLKNINFLCEEKKLIGIAGPNGSGKSTILKLISGIEKSSEGSIFLFGKELKKYGSVERAKIIRWVGQMEEIKIPYRVIDYIIFGAFPETSFFGKISGKKIEKAEELLEIFHLKEKKYFDVEKLSGGERKLLQIIFSMISEPKILLLDEPFAHLDPVHLKTLFSLIKKEKENGKSFIISSHEYNTLRFISDYILLLRNGEVVTFDETDKIPLNLWEKTFKIGFSENIQNKNQIIPDIF